MTHFHVTHEHCKYQEGTKRIHVGHGDAVKPSECVSTEAKDSMQVAHSRDYSCSRFQRTESQVHWPPGVPLHAIQQKTASHVGRRQRMSQ